MRTAIKVRNFGAAGGSLAAYVERERLARSARSLRGDDRVDPVF